MELVDKYLKRYYKACKEWKENKNYEERHGRHEDATCTDENITISEINALDGINRLETIEKIWD